MTRIFVKRFAILSNRNKGANHPPIGIKTGKVTKFSRGLKILGPCRIIYDPKNPMMPEESEVWIETEAEIEEL